MIELDGRNISGKGTDEEILNRIFDCGYLLQTNNHPLLTAARELMLSDYLVVAKFRFLGYNGHQIICNDRILVERPRKYLPVRFSRNVILLSGKPTPTGGSNNWPAVFFEDDWCELQFVSNGLPYVDETNGWSIEVTDIVRICGSDCECPTGQKCVKIAENIAVCK